MDIDALESAFLLRYKEERDALKRLSEADLSTGEFKNLRDLDRLAKPDLEASLSRLGDDSRTKRLRLVQELTKFGAKAILLAGSQRGGDFLNNQLRGQWAERVALSMKVPGLRLLPFGPSTAAMPGEQDHRETVMTFRQVVLLEGKRPDLMAFDEAVWTALPQAAGRRAETWPIRLLEGDDDALIAQGRCGIEVKNSTWHYATRRKAGGGPLSITVKVEELEDFHAWESKTGLPVLFFQVLFDELYCMSFGRMLDAIDRGYVYEEGDLVTGFERGAGGKAWHRFHLADFRHRCGKVVFPSESEAQVRVLEDGNVVPYIAYRPAEATCTDADVIWTELAYRTS